jgi:ABC-type dipeptide/oligopeptide/nickel transport system permease component
LWGWHLFSSGQVSGKESSSGQFEHDPLGYLLAWIVLVETIFQWPGIGLYAYDSFQGLDYAPIMALTLVFSFFFVMVNLLTDLLYPLLDPRIRVG